MNNFARQLSFTSYTVIFLLLLYGNQKVSRGYYDQLIKYLENDYESSVSHYREPSDTFFKMTVKAASIFSLITRIANSVGQGIRENIEDLLHRADLEMYEVKKARKEQQT